MDFTTIIASLIGGCVTLIGVFITNAKTQAVMEERIKTLTTQVEKHNSVIERTYDLESRLALSEQDRKTLWHEIDELKGA